MTARLTVEVSDQWLATLQRLADEMTFRLSQQIDAGAVMAALMKLGLRSAGIEACGVAATSFDLTQLSQADWDQIDSAVAKLMLHGVRGAS
jgi:hypothetical protein